MKKKCWAILLTICMLVGLLPITAFAAEETSDCLLTFEYPENLCTMYAYDVDNTAATYYSGDRAPAGTFMAYEIKDIAEGYRIGNVTVNGSDWTSGFVNGAYGGLATSLNKDTTIVVSLEQIPEVLPTVTEVTLTMDSEPVSGSVTIDENTGFLGQASYSDGKEYPDYYIGGVWEYSIDGTTWTQDLIWGSNRCDYWPGWGSRPADEYPIDMVTGSYDLRLRVTPKNLYAAGGEVLSNVIHINGGANKEQGDTELHQLSAPTDLKWGTYYYYEGSEVKSAAYTGMASYTVTDSEYDQKIVMKIYEENGDADIEVWNTGETKFWAGGRTCRTNHDFSLSYTFEKNATYYFTVQAIGDGTTTLDSEIVTSATWEYTKPTGNISAPAELVWEDDLVATWNNVEGAGGYTIQAYYSADDANATSVDGLTRKVAYVYYNTADGDQTSFDVLGWLRTADAGYYYFRMKTVSADITAANHSEWSDLSAAYAYGDVESGSGEDPDYGENVGGFTDVEADAYYADAVLWAVDMGITNGYGSATTFCPDITCTRGQIVTFLWRANGSPEPASLENPFTDVSTDAYYYKAVLWAVENGITSGYGSDTIFNPDGECTRGQVATFLWRAEGKPDMSHATNPFTDVAAGEFYYDAVLWAVENGVTNGYGSANTFCPDVSCTRGQIVTFLCRAMN